MAQNLNNGLNRFGIDELVLGINDPSLAGLTAAQILDIMNHGQGINRQDAESGIYLTESTDDASTTTVTEIEVWGLYYKDQTHGWAPYQTITLSDAAFANGHAIAWKDHVTYGELKKLYFKINPTIGASGPVNPAEGITLHPIKRVILTSSHRDSDSELKEDFINWYSNSIDRDQATGVTELETKNFDGYKRIYHDLSSYTAGDTFSVTVEGAVDDALSFGRMVEEFDCSYTWDASTETTTISFTVPYGPTSDPFDLTNDEFHTWYSLGDAPKVPFQMSITIPKGESQFWLPLLQTQDLVYDFTINWGDGTEEHYTTADLQLYDNSQYNAGFIDVLGNDADGWEGHSNASYVINHTYSTEDTFTISISAERFGGFAWGHIVDDNTNNVNELQFFTPLEIYNYNSNSNNPVAKSRTFLKSIDKWGSLPFEDLQLSFQYCTELDVLADDIIDLSNLFTKSLDRLFGHCHKLTNANESISKWDVSSIEKFDYMFYAALLFNIPLNTNEVTLDNGDRYLAWDVREGRSFDRMFGSNSSIGRMSFNQDLHYWNCQRLKTASLMFAYGNFNGNVTPQTVSPYALGWNPTAGLPSQWTSWSFICPDAAERTGNYNNLSGIFSGNPDFNQDLSEWVLWPFSTHPTTLASMFENCTQFDSYVEKKQVTIKDENGDDITVDAWDTIRVQNASRTFKDCMNFLGNGIYTWFPSGSSNTTLAEFAKGAFNFNANVNSWDTSNVQYMNQTFESCGNFNASVSSWNTDNVITMKRMFAYATSFNSAVKPDPYDQDAWQTGNVEDFSEMFLGCVSFNQDLIGMDFSRGVSMHGFLKDCVLYDSNWWHLAYFQANGNAFGTNTSYGNIMARHNNHYLKDFVAGTAYSQSEINNLLNVLATKLPDLTATTHHSSHVPYTHTIMEASGPTYEYYDGLLENLPLRPSSAAATDINSLRANGWYVGDFGSTLADGPTTYSVTATDFTWNEGEYNSLTRISDVIYPQNGGQYSTGEATITLDRVYKNYQGNDIEMLDLFELEDIGAPYPGAANRYYIRTGGSILDTQGGWVYDSESHAKHTDINFILTITDTNGGTNQINLMGSLVNLAPSLLEVPYTQLTGASPGSNQGNRPYTGLTADSVGNVFKNFVHIKKSIFNNWVKDNVHLYQRELFRIQLGVNTNSPFTWDGQNINPVNNGGGRDQHDKYRDAVPVITSVRKRMGWYNQTDGYFESRGTEQIPFLAGQSAYYIDPNSVTGALNATGWDYSSRFKWVYSNDPNTIGNGRPAWSLRYTEGTGTNNGYEVSFNANSNKGLHNENQYWDNNHDNYTYNESNGDKKYFRRAWCFTIKYKIHDACSSSISVNGPGRLQSPEYELNIIVRDNLK